MALEGPGQRGEETREKRGERMRFDYGWDQLIGIDMCEY